MSTTNPTWPLPEPDALGPIRGGDDVRLAVRSTIETWVPYYLTVLSARLAATGKIGGTNQPPNPLPPFGTWRDEPTYRNLGSGMPAAYLVTAPGTKGEPDKQGSGLYRATWRAQVRIQVFGTTWQQTLDLTSWYEKAVRWAVLQHQGLGGAAQATTWVGTSIELVDRTRNATRSVALATIGLDVTLANVIDSTRGPKTVPSTPTPGQDETVTEVVIDFTKVPITEPI